MNSLSYFRSAVLVILITVAAIPAHSQIRKVPVVTREGSWVVEWTPKSRQCIIRFYNDRQELIYQEIMDRFLNISRRQTKQNLNTALEQAMYVWKATHQMPTDRQWVAVQFDKN